jgi:hypothetical protein
MPQVWHDNQIDESKRVQLDRVMARVRFLGGDAASALDRLIAEIQLNKRMDRQSVLRMPIADFAVAFDSSEKHLDVLFRDFGESHRHSFSKAENDILEKCASIAAESADIKNNVKGRQLFHAVLTIIIRFLKIRLDMTQGHDGAIAYLYRNTDETPPVERDLHDDFFRFAQAISHPEYEVSDIGGGRVDIRFASLGEQLVVEVKREMRDSSFNSLVERYSAQAFEYQKTGIRVGFLLVLDLAADYTTGVPHIGELVDCQLRQVAGPSDQRCLVIVRIPAGRVRPSDMS